MPWTTAIPSILDFLKFLLTKLAFPGFLAAVVALLLPGDWRASEPFRFWCVLVAVLFAAVMLQHVCVLVRKAVQATRSVRRSLEGLSSTEREILGVAIESDTKTIELRVGDPSGQALEAKGITKRASTVATIDYNCALAYVISDDAWEYLKKHPGVYARTNR